MFDNKRNAIDEGSSYRYVQKQVPFTVKEIQHPDEIVAWRKTVEERSKQKRITARSKSVEAFMTTGKLLDVSKNNFDPNGNPFKDTAARNEYFKSINSKAKPSIFQRIYAYLTNLFLNINYEPKETK